MEIKKKERGPQEISNKNFKIIGGFCFIILFIKYKSTHILCQKKSFYQTKNMSNKKKSRTVQNLLQLLFFNLKQGKRIVLYENIPYSFKNLIGE